MYWPALTDASAIGSIKKIPVNQTALKDFEFGNAVIPDEASNFLYIYGHRKNWMVLEPYLARCPLDNVMGKWEFYDGSSWTTDLTKASKISNETVSPSFSAIKLNNKYYIITQENGFLTCGLGRQMFACSSDTPYGPFVNKKTIWVINDKYKGSYMITYNGTAHPEFNANNELLISYNVNGICPNECQNTWADRMNADTYRPKFVRVPFEVLDKGYAFQPQPVINASVTSGTAPLNVEFKGWVSVGDGGLTYSWNFGDGSPVSTLRDPYHLFTEQGAFKVELTVKDSKNNTATSAITIYSGITEKEKISGDAQGAGVDRY
jgi:PKD repeat protein